MASNKGYQSEARELSDRVPGRHTPVITVSISYTIDDVLMQAQSQQQYEEASTAQLRWSLNSRQALASKLKRVT
ncbi:hypothetical protein ONZ45_g8766 [Pleurotus djamor]|nr:hypothetical protein ONZ45_g8766 [Pleurotus djamor]